MKLFLIHKSCECSLTASHWHRGFRHWAVGNGALALALAWGICIKPPALGSIGDLFACIVLKYDSIRFASDPTATTMRIAQCPRPMPMPQMSITSSANRHWDIRPLTLSHWHSHWAMRTIGTSGHCDWAIGALALCHRGIGQAGHCHHASGSLGH